MKRIFTSLAFAAALMLGGCAKEIATIQAGIAVANTAVVTTDKLLRDKCDYAQSGAAIVEEANNVVPPTESKTIRVVQTVLRGLTGAIKAYCGGEPVEDAADALKRLETWIVNVRPIAKRIGK